MYQTYQLLSAWCQLKNHTYILQICLSMYDLLVDTNNLECQGSRTEVLRIYKPFKHQPHKMVKHTQAICRLLSTKCVSVFDHFVRLALKGLRAALTESVQSMSLLRNFIKIIHNTYCGQFLCQRVSKITIVNF